MSEEYSVGYEEGYQAGWNAAIDADTAPPQREWVEPSDEQIAKVRDDVWCVENSLRDFARAVLKLAKELNHR